MNGCEMILAEVESLKSAPDSADLDEQVLCADEEALYARLGTLSPAQYAKKREALAQELGVTVAFLDLEWKERRKASRSNSSEDGNKLFSKVEPWPIPVEGDELLDSIVQRLKRCVVSGEDEAVVATLWAVFAWTHDAAVHSPMLLVTSAEMNSGKTTLLGLLRFLVPRALMIVEISEAVLYRAIDKWKPTLIVDEADVLFKDNPVLRAVINSGWTRGSGVPRCHPETHEPDIFPTFGPKAIGMKGTRVPDTTLGRSIVIEMFRKKPGEQVDDFEHIDDPAFATCRRMLSRWAADNVDKLRAARPEVPEGFHNRLAANWRPLLAIADLVGGRWPELARKAAVKLSPLDASSVGTMLLADIKAMFEAGETDRLPSEDIVKTLHGLEDRPWAEWGRAAKPISKNQLANLLRPFKIVSGTIRTATGTPKGYYLNAFDEAFERYLDPPSDRPPLSETPHRHNACGTGTSATFQNATPQDDVAFQKCEKPLRHNGCGDVADENAPPWEEGSVRYVPPEDRPALGPPGEGAFPDLPLDLDRRPAPLHPDDDDPDAWRSEP